MGQRQEIQSIYPLLPLEETMDIVSILWGPPLLCVSTASRHHAKINKFKVNFGVFN